MGIASISFAWPVAPSIWRFAGRANEFSKCVLSAVRAAAAKSSWRDNPFNAQPKPKRTPGRRRLCTPAVTQVAVALKANVIQLV